jgi:hypothetical protein
MGLSEIQAHQLARPGLFATKFSPHGDQWVESRSTYPDGEFYFAVVTATLI